MGRPYVIMIITGFDIPQCAPRLLHPRGCGTGEVSCPVA
jgi:hypothetical protein